MVTRPLVVVLACSIYLLVIQIILPKTKALRINPNVDEFMIENQRTRTHTRQNYVVQRALDDELSGNLDNSAVGDAFEAESKPEELSAQIVDYANLIRNDIIFLDNSVETTSRKKGNIRKKNHAIQDPQCNCESERDLINLGDNYYPSKIENLKCMEGSCPHSYRCKAIYYYITVLRRKSSLHKEESPMIPSDLHHRWVAHRMNVTTSCVCARDSIDLN